MINIFLKNIILPSLLILFIFSFSLLNTSVANQPIYQPSLLDSITTKSDRQFWINSEPLSREALKGKVVLVQFWTYACYNCQNTLPYIKKWHETYKDKGLVIIGVHCPEFAFESKINNVRNAVIGNGISYPVIMDNEFNVWRAFNNHFWPGLYLMDKNNTLVYTHFGEGNYDITESKIQELLSAPNLF